MWSVELLSVCSLINIIIFITHNWKSFFFVISHQMGVTEMPIMKIWWHRVLNGDILTVESWIKKNEWKIMEKQANFGQAKVILFHEIELIFNRSEQIT